MVYIAEFLLRKSSFRKISIVYLLFYFHFDLPAIFVVHEGSIKQEILFKFYKRKANTEIGSTYLPTRAAKRRREQLSSSNYITFDNKFCFKHCFMYYFTLMKLF